MNDPATRRFPSALLASYGLGLGLGFGAIPVAAWVCDSSRDPSGMGYTLCCALGALAGVAAWVGLSLASLFRRERVRAAAITNLALAGAMLLAAFGAWILG